MDYTFLSENYVLIIVIAVIVVMTIVGYIADKTNFGEKKEKIPKENKKKVFQDEPVENNEETNDQLIPDDATQEEKLNTDLEDSNDIGFDSFEPVAPLNDDHLETSEMNFEMPSDIKEQEDIQNPVPNEIPEDEPMNSEIQEENENNSLENVDNSENSNVNDSVVPSVDEMKIEPVDDSISEETNPTEEVNATDDFALPSIDKLNQEIADVEDDEDVWKF